MRPKPIRPTFIFSLAPQARPATAAAAIPAAPATNSRRFMAYPLRFAFLAPAFLRRRGRGRLSDGPAHLIQGGRPGNDPVYRTILVGIIQGNDFLYQLPA